MTVADIAKRLMGMNAVMNISYYKGLWHVNVRNHRAELIGSAKRVDLEESAQEALAKAEAWE